jgi:hypothetical protein
LVHPWVGLRWLPRWDKLMQRWSASVGERPCPAQRLERRTKKATDAARHQATKPWAHGRPARPKQKKTTSFSPAERSIISNRASRTALFFLWLPPLGTSDL